MTKEYVTDLCNEWNASELDGWTYAPTEVSGGNFGIEVRDEENYFLGILNDGGRIFDSLSKILVDTTNLVVR